MAIEVSERFESRRIGIGENPWAEYVYDVIGVEESEEETYEEQVETAVLAEAPEAHDGIPLIAVEPIERIGEYHWRATVRYAHAQGGSFLQPGQSSFAFEIGGGTQHITQSKETIANYAIGDADPPDFKGAIGVTAEGVEGVDIQVPVFHFSETHIVAAETVTESYKAKIFGLYAKTNDAIFRGYAIGEVLFLGATGNRRGTLPTDPWEITYRFAAQPNATGLTVGELTEIDKKGWEYLWVRYADHHDETLGVLIKRPVSVHVERVYDAGDFSELGI